MDVNVNQYDFQDDQIVVATVPVPPNMHFHEVQDHLQQVAKAFKNEFDRTKKDPNLFIFPMNPNGLTPKFQVITPPPTGSSIVLQVPVGGLKPTEIPSYLKTIKESLLVDWDEKFPGVNLVMFGILENGENVKVNVNKPKT